METEREPKQSRKPTLVRRREIIAAGMRILTSEGARQFTAERLGCEVGITSGTIFRHFGSMDEILDAIVDCIEGEIFVDFPPQADDPLTSLRLFFEGRVHVMSSRPEISKLLQTNLLVPSVNADYRQERLQKFKLRSREFVTQCLEKADQEKLLASDVTPEEGVVLVLGCIHAIAHLGIGTGNAEGNSDLARRTWRLIDKMLRGTD